MAPAAEMRTKSHKK